MTARLAQLCTVMGTHLHYETAESAQFAQELMHNLWLRYEQLPQELKDQAGENMFEEEEVHDNDDDDNDNDVEGTPIGASTASRLSPPNIGKEDDDDDDNGPTSDEENATRSDSSESGSDEDKRREQDESVSSVRERQRRIQEYVSHPKIGSKRQKAPNDDDDDGQPERKQQKLETVRQESVPQPKMGQEEVTGWFHRLTGWL